MIILVFVLVAVARTAAADVVQIVAVDAASLCSCSAEYVGCLCCVLLSSSSSPLLVVLVVVPW